MAGGGAEAQTTKMSISIMSIAATMQNGTPRYSRKMHAALLLLLRSAIKAIMMAN